MGKASLVFRSVRVQHTLKMVLRSVIFSTPKSGKIIHNQMQNALLPAAHPNILRSVIYSTAGIFKRQDKPW